MGNRPIQVLVYLIGMYIYLQPRRPLQVRRRARGLVQVQQRPDEEGVVVREPLHRRELALEDAAAEAAGLCVCVTGEVDRYGLLV